MSEKKDLKVAPEAKALPDEALEGVAGGVGTGIANVQNVGLIGAARQVDPGAIGATVVATVDKRATVVTTVAGATRPPVAALEEAQR